VTIFRWIRGAARIHGEVTNVGPMPGMRAAESLDLDQIHARHADFVWRSLQRLGVRPADLEDQLQEVFLVVHRRLASFDGSSQLTTWLFGICLRVASGYRQRAYVRREHSTPQIEALDSRAPERGPEEAALATEARRELEFLLDQLDPAKRAVVVMFEIEGKSAPEIAALMGTPVGTVYSRLTTARAELRAAADRVRHRNARKASR
jgi:RNA polymerase sigma-70 factor (ECF subfamily)